MVDCLLELDRSRTPVKPGGAFRHLSRICSRLDGRFTRQNASSLGFKPKCRQDERGACEKNAERDAKPPNRLGLVAIDSSAARPILQAKDAATLA